MVGTMRWPITEDLIRFHFSSKWTYARSNSALVLWNMIYSNYLTVAVEVLLIPKIFPFVSGSKLKVAGVLIPIICE